MHFRKFFYRDYFDGLKLQKPITDEIKDHNKPIIERKNDVLKNAVLPQTDHRLLIHSLPASQASQLIEVATTYPGLIIGTGYEHETLNEGEFKLGFYFDCTTGLPCIPGSSIKGVLRSVFPQFRERHPCKTTDEPTEVQRSKIDYIANIFGWDNDNTKKVHQLEQAIFEGVDLAATEKNFDDGKEDVVYNSIYHRFCFYNGYISHATGENKIFEIDTITPHTAGPLKNPTPLNFLKIRPGVTFTLPMILRNIDLLEIKTDRLKLLFTNIIKLVGIGAKTNVGYGQFK